MSAYFLANDVHKGDSLRKVQKKEKGMKKSGEVNINKLISDLRAIVGAPYVSDDIYECVSYAKDPMPWDIEEKNIPYAVVRPGSAKEISESMVYLSKRKIPVHLHGLETRQGIPGRRRSSVIIATGWV
jgi:hypothetical protein